MEKIDYLIFEAIKEYIKEGRYSDTATPYNSKSDTWHDLGVNPLTVDNGNHTPNDVLSQVSTVDYNGQNFKTNGNDLVVSDNKFIIYKIKNFGNDKIDSTLSLFGRGARGEKELRKAIDTVNGGATRNGRHVMWRTITSLSNQNLSKHSGQMSKTFWEFSLDGGLNWYIMKPHPLQSMQRSKVVLKSVTKESRTRYINEAADDTFSLEELSNIHSFRQKVAYCREHLGTSIGNGSSRLVFQVTDEKCLKLAKNNKGIAQNQLEGEGMKQNMICFPKIFEQDENDQWILCEYVLPAKESDFQHCLGLTWDEFVQFIGRCYNEYDRNRFNGRASYSIMKDDEQFEELIENNENLSDIYTYMTDYQPPLGDLVVIQNYGMVRRDGEDLIVILDHGLSNNIWNDYYKRR